MGIKSKIVSVIKKINKKEIIAIPKVVSDEELLKGKIALITGGSGGIGSAISETFVRNGAKVIIVGTNENKLNAVSEKIGLKNSRVFVLNFENVTDLETQVETASGLFEEHRIDILVNCAGVNSMKNFFEINETDFDSTMNINLKSVFFMSQAVSKHMIKHGVKGHILNISSSSALRPAWTPYEISKWGIKGFTKGLADSLLPYGIIVNALAPGPTATAMLGKKSDGDISLDWHLSKRYALPEEIANLAVVLASDMGTLIIGDTLYATGGSGVISLHK